MEFSQQIHQVHIIIINPNLQMKTLRFREIKSFEQNGMDSIGYKN